METRGMAVPFSEPAILGAAPSPAALAGLASRPNGGANAPPSTEPSSMSRLVVALLAVAGVCLANAASAQERSRLDDVIRAGKLRVCTPGDYKPFSLAKPDGSYEGLDIDLMRSAAKSLGVQPE